MFIIVLLLILIVIILLIGYYYFLKPKKTFWEELGVKGPRPIPFFGNDITTFIGITHPSELNKYYYEKFKNEKMVGIFLNNLPVLIVKDESLIKDVLRKDASVFSDRGIHLENDDEMKSLHNHIFNLSKIDSKELKSSLSKVFLTSYIEKKSKEITDIIENFLLYVDKYVQNSNSIDICNFLFQLTTAIIANYGFSIEMNQFSNPITDLKSNNKRSFTKFFKQYHREYPAPFQSLGAYICKHIINFKSGSNKPKKDFYVKLNEDVVKYRNKSNLQKKDYIGRVIDFVNDENRIRTGTL
jgi:hypothetical protein